MLLGHVGRIQSVAFDGSGSLVATSSTDQTARVWRAATGALVAALFGHTAPVEDVSFGPDAVLVTASADWTARTWRGNGRPAEVLVGHRGAVTRAAYVSARRRVVTVGADGTMRLWDPGTSIELVRTRVEDRRPRACVRSRPWAEPSRSPTGATSACRPAAPNECSAVTRIS